MLDFCCSKGVFPEIKVIGIQDVMAGAYTLPLFDLNVSIFCGIRCLASVYEWQERLRSS